MRLIASPPPWMLLLLIASGALPLQAQTVYRCQSPSGQVLFSDEPCPAGSRVERVNVQPNSIDASPIAHAPSRAHRRLLRRLRRAKPFAATRPIARRATGLNPSLAGRPNAITR